MGGKNVKNTMVERVLHYIAPHPCFGCGKIGTLLCDNCKYDITSEPFSGCFVCQTPCSRGVCREHKLLIEDVRVIGIRHSALKALMDGLKFRSIRAATTTAASLLDEGLPLYPPHTIVTSVPTVRSHIRQRGFDHAALIARQFAAKRGLLYVPLLGRANKITQHRLNRSERLKSAEHAFTLASDISINTPVLLIDDIITTGATISQAALTLHDRCDTIFVGALAYQPLD